MFNAKNWLPTSLQEFLELVEAKSVGYDVYLGGGFLRDVWWNIQNVENLHIAHGDYWGQGVKGKQPKDVDLFFIPKAGAEVKILPVIPKTYINFDCAASEVDNVRDNVDHVRGLYVASLNTSNVQFITYDNPMTMKQLAEDMDCNINQAMFDIKNNLTYCTDEFYLGHEDRVLEMLHQFEPKRMVSRVLRMMDKFPNYQVKHNMEQDVYDKFKKELTTFKTSGSSGTCGVSFMGD